MFFKRAICVALLATTAPCLAADDEVMVARKALPKLANHRMVVPPDATGRVLVKFNDDLRVRVADNGMLISTVNADLTELRAVVDQFELNIYSAFEQSEEVLTEIQTRAMERTGKAQPDLSGMMYVDGQANMMPAAKALNSLDLVEFVSFDRVPRIGYDGPGPVASGDGGGGGVAGGAGFMVCSEAFHGCYDPNPNPGCNDTACCNTVCNLESFCCEQFWDAFCASLAGEHCGPLEEPNCMGAADSCFTDNGAANPGCNDEDCCNLICTFDASCCDVTWDQVCADAASSICADEPGGTPNFESLQGYKDKNRGGYNLVFAREIGDDLMDLGFGDVNGAFGYGLKVGVIEDAYIEGHEDLLDVILEPGVEQLDLPIIVDGHHGTACLGELVAADNGIGVTGIVPGAQGYFFPTVSKDQPGGRLMSSIASAISMFGPGDVISFSIGFAPGPLESDPGVFTLLTLATDLGIITCQAAGNSCVDLENTPNGQIAQWRAMLDAAGPTGSTIVGAGMPVHPAIAGGDCPTLDEDEDPCEITDPFQPAQYSRLDFSNFYRSIGVPPTAATRYVTVQGWGTNVMTCGYGNIFRPDGDAKRSYTTNFGGTSAAAPMTAGAMAVTQGLAKQFFGIPIGPETIKGLVAGNIFLQDGVPEFLVPGRRDTDLCIQCCRTTDEDPELIGGFPRMTAIVASLITGNFFDGSPFVDDVTVFRGELLQGNRLSIKESDNLRLVIRSEYTEPSDSAHETGEGPDPVYYLFAQTTDIEITATIGSNPDIFVDHVVVSVEGSSTASSGTSLIIAEAYNWTTGRREFLGFRTQDQVETPVAPYDYEFDITHASRYVNSDGRMLLRFWTIALGGTTISPYTQRYDYVLISATDEQGEVIPPGGDP